MECIIVILIPVIIGLIITIGCDRDGPTVQWFDVVPLLGNATASEKRALLCWMLYSQSGEYPMTV